MEKNVVIGKTEYSNWIKNISVDSLMLTISEPHIKTKHLELTVKDMEPIISKIISMANSAAFGKDKHFEFLKGIIVCENVKEEKEQPHFHIILNKPQHLNFGKFQEKITKVSTSLCDKNFKFDLSDSYLTFINKYFLTNHAMKDLLKREYLMMYQEII